MPKKEVRFKPHPGPQTLALSVNNVRELNFGGSRGSGKSAVGLAWLVQEPHMQHRDYRALVIRKNADDLSDWIERYSLVQIRDFIRSIQAAQEQLRLNASPRLVLEVLMLGIPRDGSHG